MAGLKKNLEGTDFESLEEDSSYGLHDIPPAVHTAWVCSAHSDSAVSLWFLAISN